MDSMLLEEDPSPTVVSLEDSPHYGTSRASAASRASKASDTSLVAGGYGDEADDNHRRSRGTTAWFDDARGVTYYYKTNPLTYSCPFILSQELCERLAYYGLTPTLKNFIKHVLDTGDSSASAYLGAFQGTMFVTPIVSAIIADTYLGGFKTILTFSVVYMVGLSFMLLAAIDAIAQPWMLHLGLLVLISFGAGGIKSCVNVFGAQQFHPVLQKDKITSFFTLFYASINIGSLIGGLSCPQVAESVSYFAAYTIPLASFTLATGVFALGTSRYVKMLPSGSPVLRFGKLMVKAARHCSIELCKVSRGGTVEDSFVDASIALLKLMPLCALQVPLLVAYNQMTTAFLTQGEKMDRNLFGVEIAAAMMQNVDPIVVILASLLIEKKLYPALRDAEKMPSVLTRFLLGNILGAASVMSAFVVELFVKSDPLHSVSVWWQIPQFAFIAVGEVFMLSTGYEVAFTYAPSELKTVSSACNLLFFAIAGYLSGGLFLICADWMPDFDASVPSTYRDAHYDYYFLVLAGACLLGCVACFAIRPFFRKMAPYHSLAADEALVVDHVPQ